MHGKITVFSQQFTLRWTGAVVAGIGILMLYTTCTVPKPAPDAATAMHLIGTEQYQQAIDALNPIINAYPDSLRWLRLRGFAFDGLLRYKEGIADFTEVLRHKPEDVATLNNRGYALYQSGRLTDALADYSRALFLSPDFVAARSNRALVLVALGHYANALNDIEHAIKCGSTTNSTLYNLQGYCLLQQKQPTAAISAFDEAIELEDGYSDAQRNRAAAYRMRDSAALTLQSR